MDKEKEFKELLDNKLNSVEFEFDEGAWHGANALLNEHHENKKRIAWWPFLAASLLIMGLATGVYFLSREGDTKISTVKEGNLSVESASVEGEKNINQGSQIKTSSTSDVNHQNDFDANHTNETGAQPAKINNQKINSSSISAGHTSDYDKKTFAQNGKKSSGKKNGKTDKTNETTKLPNAKHNPVNGLSNHAEVLPKPENNNADNNSIQMGGTNPADNTEYEHLVSLFNFNGLLPTLAEPELSFNPLSLDNVKYKNSIRRISVEGGVNYMFGWNNSGVRDANGFNPLFGINYSYIPARKLYYTIGFQYYSIGHLLYSSHISKATRYGLGEESNVFEVTPNKLHFLAIPLKLNWKLDKKITLGAGVNLAYLLTVSSTVETYDLKVNKKHNYVKTKETGYTEGFMPVDAQISLFAKYRIYKRLEANLEAYYGVVDQKNNTFFNSPVTERNKGLKFTLTYDIFGY